MIAAAPPETCSRCQTPNYQVSLFCNNCRVYLRDETRYVERVTYTRRFWGDYILEGLLFVLTLGIGWFIWLIFTSQTGQSPAKRLLGVRVLNLETGRRISQGETWIREVIVKMIAVTLVGFIIPFASLIDGIWVFFDKNRQALHDKILKQVVVYAPAGLPEALEFVENAPPVYEAPPLIPQQTPVRAAPTVTDTAEQLRELQRLHTDGVLTDEEYEQKRKAIVDKM